MVGMQIPTASSAVDLQTQAHKDDRGNPNGQHPGLSISSVPERLGVGG